MGKNSKIEWTDHTFNPWWGCTKVSGACKNCYAESWAKRVGQQVWGPSSPRRLFSDRHWQEPIKWNSAAEKDGSRLRVFCASMADVFEDRPELDRERAKLWSLIYETPNLDWLLLTKRPQHVTAMTPFSNDWPNNIWLGTTVESQELANERLSYLSNIPARIRFISAEPLLGPIKIERYLKSSIDWVITGGESGPRARPSSPSWFRELLGQCKRAKVPFHFKQWGDWAPGDDDLGQLGPTSSRADDGTIMRRVGKKLSGRLLDGHLHDGLPETRVA